MATDPNATGLLTDPVTPFDITPFTDYSALTAVGDPRASLGETMTQTFIHFLPRMITQTEVRQNGGSQVIDNYICTADGTPIKLSETLNAILSLDLTGQKAYQYGAITIPPISATMEELMKPIDPAEVTNFVKNYVSSARDACASDFVAFIDKYFSGYTKKADVYQNPPSLIITLNDNIKTVFIKYYVDVALKTGCALGINAITQHTTTTVKNYKLIAAMSSSIPNYKLFLTDIKAANEHYAYIMSNFVDDGSIDYNSTSFADVQKRILSLAPQLTAKKTNNPLTISCSSV
jgi:hypothetical protein